MNVPCSFTGRWHSPPGHVERLWPAPDETFFARMCGRIHLSFDNPPPRPLRPDERSLHVMGIAFNEQGIAELMCSVVIGGELCVDAAEQGLIEESA